MCSAEGKNNVVTYFIRQGAQAEIWRVQIVLQDGFFRRITVDDGNGVTVPIKFIKWYSALCAE